MLARLAAERVCQGVNAYRAMERQRQPQVERLLLVNKGETINSCHRLAMGLMNVSTKAVGVETGDGET
jgi:hypothetical protein